MEEDSRADGQWHDLLVDPEYFEPGDQVFGLGEPQNRTTALPAPVIPRPPAIYAASTVGQRALGHVWVGGL